MTEVLKIRNILYLGFALLQVGCSGDEITAENDFDPVGKPVLFSVGLEAQATTRTASNMANGGRFVCTMYYHSKTTDTDDNDYDIKAVSEGGTMNTVWLQVDGDAGNAVYKNSDYTADATSFYWQNQLTHAFLAIADYNKLTTNDGATTDQGKLKMYPNYDKEFEESTPYRYANSYDLTKGTRTSITQQPDPIRAWKLMKPEGENRRVTLNFEHQFSQIQVNVTNANSSVDLTGKIKKVELLGVTTEGYVFSRINANGNVDASTYKTVDNSTSFEMFSTTTADGYQGSYNAIAFGHLYAIRVSWYEGTAEAPIVTHTPTLLVDRILESGKRYIFNLSLSRGSLNVINTNIVDWALTEYNLDAGIIN